jgi:hypothetical protein
MESSKLLYAAGYVVVINTEFVPVVLVSSGNSYQDVGM